MKRYRAEIKEVGNDHVLTPSYVGDADIKYLEDFWGCHNPDVEWFRIYEEEAEDYDD